MAPFDHDRVIGHTLKHASPAGTVITEEPLIETAVEPGGGRDAAGPGPSATARDALATEGVPLGHVAVRPIGQPATRPGRPRCGRPGACVTALPLPAPSIGAAAGERQE
jgi:hypothetical protein